MLHSRAGRTKSEAKDDAAKQALESLVFFDSSALESTRSDEQRPFAVILFNMDLLGSRSKPPSAVSLRSELSDVQVFCRPPPNAGQPDARPHRA
ncbi:hypothetical protein M407DRAFT_32931 [Tulasnella calospora MUT 4182]|uniref:DRBM domain-containing protein n=1 Tax=Tulasnella calospora MUT 4182 TaxID=1051891 RepID=A0A0C3Q364_9AGAM|nr:hypothetical protein M407DRAFT_32931 [Tulasnella calospora MUT 4182]